MLGPAGGGGACDYGIEKEEKEGDDWARGARDSPNLRTRGTDGRHAFFRVGTELCCPEVVVNGGYQSTRVQYTTEDCTSSARISPRMRWHLHLHRESAREG
jgi:hypothetical protein